MPRPSLATETPEERRKRQAYYDENAPRCPDCPIEESGYPPEIVRKFSVAGEFAVYQCPNCKEIVVRHS